MYVADTKWITVIIRKDNKIYREKCKGLRL